MEVSEGDGRGNEEGRLILEVSEEDGKSEEEGPWTGGK